MKVHTFVFSITSLCVVSSRSGPAITYLPTSFSGMSQHSFAPPPESSFGFSGPTAYTVSGFSSPSKYFGSFDKSYVRRKIFAVIPHKFGVQTSGYDVSGVNNFEEEYHPTPAHYEFQYKVHDHYHGSDFGHTESRRGNIAKGQYMVLLPDGRRQIVDYIADSHGYRPTIRYEGGHEKIRYGR